MITTSHHSVAAAPIDWAWWVCYAILKEAQEVAGDDDQRLGSLLLEGARILVESPDGARAIVNDAMPQAKQYLRRGATPFQELLREGEPLDSQERAPAVAVLVTREIFQQLKDTGVPETHAIECFRWCLWSVLVDLLWEDSLYESARISERVGVFLQLQTQRAHRAHMMLTFGLTLGEAVVRRVVSHEQIRQVARDFGHLPEEA